MDLFSLNDSVIRYPLRPDLFPTRSCPLWLLPCDQWKEDNVDDSPKGQSERGSESGGSDRSMLQRSGRFRRPRQLLQHAVRLVRFRCVSNCGVLGPQGASSSQPGCCSILARVIAGTGHRGLLQDAALIGDQGLLSQIGDFRELLDETSR